MGRKMTKFDNTNDLFLHCLGEEVSRARVVRHRPIKKNKFINTIKGIKQK
tara:strand:- start:375 stop:524 length:150 start_codon:yes stop_codon:yes gene_type:complete